MADLYDKTEKGREEIATRKYQLSPRLRSLLLVIDGKHGADEILAKFKGIGLHESSLNELIEAGFVQRAGPQAHLVRATGAPAQEEAVAVVPPAAAASPIAEGQFHALYRFYSETIRSTVGLRGYALQLKVERAASIDDFRTLREPYLKAVEKAKGHELARSLADRLDRLLAPAASPADGMRDSIRSPQPA